MKGVLGFDCDPKDAFTSAGGLYTKSLAELFLESDIVCVCVPLTDDTRGLVSNEMMSLLRPDSLLINVARGGVIDQRALTEHLKAGSFRAALDNFLSEDGWSELCKVPRENLLMTPHIGYRAEASL